MGWGKYLEDIHSRAINDNYFRENKTLRVPVPLKGKKKQKEHKLIPQLEKQMSPLKEFTMSTARPLPVILLADVSGSMSTNGKIDVLNEAVSEMIQIFAEEDDTRAEIHVSVITFGGKEAILHTPLQSADSIKWQPMEAIGRTPMGHAFHLAQEMIEDKTMIPSRAYRPTVILVSDGIPTDDWRGSLENLLNSERASKAMRFAMGIGEEADNETLNSFLGSSDDRVFHAHEARKIKNFFRWVTMSVTTRSKSATPDDEIDLNPDDFDFDY